MVRQDWPTINCLQCCHSLRERALSGSEWQHLFLSESSITLSGSQKSSVLNQPSISVESLRDIVHIAVPMKMPYVPVPKRLFSNAVVAIIFVPVWLILSSVGRAVFRVSAPPRALFEIDNDRLRMTLCARDSGEQVSYEWPRWSLSPVRKNKFGEGIWINARGRSTNVFLRDLPDQTIEQICIAIQKAFEAEKAEFRDEPDYEKANRYLLAHSDPEWLLD